MALTPLLMRKRPGSPERLSGSLEPENFLEQHLNVEWLRPGTVLWDAVASRAISQLKFEPPSLDLGAGNGIFSFITAGGAFTRDYDWYRNINLKGFWENEDVYNHFSMAPRPEWFAQRPRHRITWALDAKQTLLRQAQGLDFYNNLVVSDANRRWPFQDESLQTVFSNILYWLRSTEASLKEIRRVLRPGGKAFLCLPDPSFKKWCVSYDWRTRNSESLRLLNRGRAESMLWTITWAELKGLAGKYGFKVESHATYLSPITLRTWDVGLRPLFPALYRMVKKMSEADRLEVKEEWIQTTRPFLRELYDLDRRDIRKGGYHLVSLEKKTGAGNGVPFPPAPDPRQPERQLFLEDYDHYVFKEGRLVGDFDNMYRYSKRVPWDQDTRCNHWTAQVGLEMLEVSAPYGSILEIGCGLGYITNKLKGLSKRRGGTVEAFDVSPDAIRKARRLHPGIRFYEDNILRPGFKPRRPCQLVVVREMFWYVYPQMELAVRNILSCLAPGGLLYIGQYFPALDRPFIGKETIPSPEALVNFFPSLVPVSTAVVRNHALANDGPILHYIGLKPK